MPFNMPDYVLPPVARRPTLPFLLHNPSYLYAITGKFRGGIR